MLYIFLFFIFLPLYGMNRNDPDQQSQDDVSMKTFIRDDYSDDFEVNDLLLDNINTFFDSFALDKEKTLDK